MKKYVLLVLSIIALAAPVKASHIYGGEMTYQHVSGNDYLLSLVLYRECFGIPLPTNAVVLAQSDSTCGLSSQFVLGFVSSMALPLNMCDTSTNFTGCNGPGGYGIEKWTYQGLITLPGACANWELSYSSCCMTNSVSNVLNPGSASIYISVTIDNLNYPGNSSPSFNFEPLTSFCLNVLNCFNHSASDQDGDSISYSLVAYPAVTYVAPNTATNPIPTSGGVNLNSNSGILTLTPNMTGAYLVSVEADEYRNGVWLGSIKRHMIYPVFVGQFPAVNFATGTVFTDYNNNQTQDTGEPGVPNILVGSSPVATFGSTNSAGQYGISVPAGSATISILNPPKYHTVNPASHLVVTTGVCSSDSGNHFALTPHPNVIDACVRLDELSFARPGRITRHGISLRNLGTDTIAAGIVTYIHDTALTYISSTPIADSINGNTLMWNYTSLLPAELRYASVDLQVDTSQATLVVLDHVLLVTPILGDSDVVNNVDSLAQTVRGSWDPNDKYVEPSGGIDIVDVSAGMWLEYTVRFQNTGNDTAFYVMLVDTLDNNLDLLSFEMISASHSYNLTATGAGLLKWEFINILLPDSNVDNIGSNGFVKYRIKPKTNLLVGTEIQNAGDIYFDFNAPVKTNRTLNTVIITTGVTGISYEQNFFTAFPNPSEGLFTIQFSETPDLTSVITVYDMMGRLVYERSVTGLKTMKLDISDQANGMYLLNYRSAKNNSSERIILNR